MLNIFRWFKETIGFLTRVRHRLIRTLHKYHIDVAKADERRDILQQAVISL